ncbi:MAG: hypothetical protein V1855_01595 [bacterium]
MFIKKSMRIVIFSSFFVTLFHHVHAHEQTRNIKTKKSTQKTVQTKKNHAIKKNQNPKNRSSKKQTITNKEESLFALKTHTQQTHTPSINFTCFNYDESSIWGIGEDHALYCTINDEWKQVSTQGVKKFLSLACAKNKIMYGLDNKGKVYRSGDNGQTWNKQIPKQPKCFDQLSIHQGHRLLAREQRRKEIYSFHKNKWTLEKTYKTEISLY